MQRHGPHVLDPHQDSFAIVAVVTADLGNVEVCSFLTSVGMAVQDGMFLVCQLKRLG